jgi:hypothetical protein
MTITRRILEDNESITFPATIFGAHFPFRIEPFIFDMARSLSRNYTGGLWTLFKLSNNGFYMSAESDKPFHVMSQNGYDGNMSADAFGVTTCLFAYSHLSFTDDQALAEKCGEQFHLLRDFALEHCEVREIFAATD